MSETTTPAANPANDMLGLMVANLTEQTNTANALAKSIAAAKGDDTAKLVHDIRETETTDDTTILGFRDWLAKLDAAREAKITEVDAYIRENLMPKNDESFNVEEAEEKFKNLRASIASGRKYAGDLGANVDDIPALTTLRGGATGSQTGIRRPRISSATVNGVDVFTENKVTVKTAENPDGEEQTKRSVSFTVLAAHIAKDSGVATGASDLSAHAFAVAKSDTLPEGVTTFSVSRGEKNYEIAVTV